MGMVEIRVPDIGDFREVEVIELLVKVGDTVEIDQSLLTVESDKATMELPAFQAGIVRRILVKIGDRVSEGSPLILLDTKKMEAANIKAGSVASAEGASSRHRVFIVHGHDDLAKFRTARFVEKLGFEAVILHEQVSGGKTIIEKIEACTNVGFAIVLYTADDKGNTKADAEAGQLENRARQNVVFEHGYLMAKLGRDRVVPLVSGRVELPSDVSGVVYVADTEWQTAIAKEMKSVGYPIDINRLM